MGIYAGNKRYAPYIGDKRRRYMGGVAAPPYDENSYVQDGLVFQLDGINKGSNEGYWTDLIGGIKFELTTHSAVQNDGIKFDGSGYISSDSNISVAHTEGTIECAYSNGGSICVILYPINVSDICLCCGSQGFAYFRSNGYNEYLTSKPSVATMSFNDQRAVINGSLLTGGTRRNDWTSPQSYITIGGRVFNSVVNRYYSNYKIMAIRFYNKFLTEQEMLFNQHIDNVRFNLGLTI